MKDPNPTCDTPQVVFEELLEEIRHNLLNRPRTLQTRIGPSEIGNPCHRALIHKLAEHPEPPRGDPGWQAWVGTQMHTGLEQIFTPALGGRYLTETRLTVGEINGVPITGSCDLFDTATGIVVDWKSKSKTSLAKARSACRPGGPGPGDLYRVQQHLYGRGWQLLGRTVKHVALVFTPRDGKLSDTFMWSEPYDESIAVEALKRATGLAMLIDALGADAALNMYPLCDQPYCDWCRPVHTQQTLDAINAPGGDPFGVTAKTRKAVA